MRLPLILMLATAPALAQSPAAPPAPSPRDPVTVLPGVVILNQSVRLAPAPCYTIRSYAFKRDDSSSDTLHPAGFTTCQPASRLRMKQADATTTR